MTKKNIRSHVLRILSALNYLYSLRDLEKILDIPFQNLWKYVNLLTVPEEKTAEKIMNRVQELHLIEQAVSNVLEKAGKEVWGLAREPGFLRLFSLVIEELIGDMEIDVIIPLSEYAVPLASIIAMELVARICPVIRHHIRYEKEGFYITYYVSRKSSELCIAAIPRKCLRKGSKALLLDVIIDEPDYVDMVLDIMRRAKAEPYYLISIQATMEVYNKLKEHGIPSIRVFNTI